MARPSRIPFLSDLEIGIVYFVTLCVKDRKKILDNKNVFREAGKVLEQLDRWIVHGFVLMPDHVHFLVSPTNRDLSVNLFSKWFKTYLNKKLPAKIDWQEGCFDRLLRKSE